MIFRLKSLQKLTNMHCHKISDIFQFRFIIINKNDLEDGVWVIEAMRKLALIQSNGEGRRLIANGGVRVNDTVISDPEKQLNVSDITIGGMIKLSAGKKRHALVKLQ